MKSKRSVRLATSLLLTSTVIALAPRAMAFGRGEGDPPGVDRAQRAQGEASQKAKQDALQTYEQFKHDFCPDCRKEFEAKLPGGAIEANIGSVIGALGAAAGKCVRSPVCRGMALARILSILPARDLNKNEGEKSGTPKGGELKGFDIKNGFQGGREFHPEHGGGKFIEK